MSEQETIYELKLFPKEASGEKPKPAGGQEIIRQTTEPVKSG